MYSTMTADGRAWPNGVGHSIAIYQTVGGVGWERRGHIKVYTYG